MSKRFQRSRYDPLAAIFVTAMAAVLITKQIEKNSPGTDPFQIFLTSSRLTFQLFWPIYAALAIMILGMLLYRWYRYRRLAASGIFEIDKMSGDEFEQRLMVLFRNLGYKTTHIGKTGDFGVDLIIEKEGRKKAIQAKRYDGNVGEAAVQQIHAGKEFYCCTDAVVVTNSNFTRAAWRLAKATNITLWSRNYLIKVLETEQTIKLKTSRPTNQSPQSYKSENTEATDQSPPNKPISDINGSTKSAAASTPNTTSQMPPIR